MHVSFFSFSFNNSTFLAILFQVNDFNSIYGQTYHILDNPNVGYDSGNWTCLIINMDISFSIWPHFIDSYQTETRKITLSGQGNVI